ncbi:MULTISPECIES: large-conductance mechanosensitive channel protein MscL [unclassified Lacticaseibacillus]|uniref:large-conductance mechanosensitive channel protein MscL n=1 Tax=unclassified Lacticaseibacillus TaxID=2759744 RepID=UPI001940F456|nr:MULTISPECIES: large-conductance mechanosensitive channel protein MscL [unclassified Lacticaseibacillus]
MLKEFKAFIMRGNVLDMAVGVIIGGAFTAVVTSLTKNLINPLIGLFLKSSSLAKLSVTVAGATFTYGQFINDVLNFLIVAFIVFLIVRTANRLLPKKAAAPAGPTQEELLTQIRDLLAKQQN